MSITLRESELHNIRKKYPDRVPIIVTRSSTSDKNTPDLKRHKFLVPNHYTFGEFIHIVRKLLSLTPEKAIFIFVTSPEKKNEIIPSPSSLLVELYETYHHRNGGLYMVYTLENTFGHSDNWTF